MNRIKTNDNVHFEEPLSEQIAFRVTVKEKSQLVTVSRNNYISIAELMRNLMRLHISDYSTSPEMKKTLFISNQIDMFLLEYRIINDRNESNLSKIREILTNFEAFCETNFKRIDKVAFISRRKGLTHLMDLVYNNDEFLSEAIDTQYRRILKSKTYKAFEQF